jgi:hypothetical protein
MNRPLQQSNSAGQGGPIAGPTASTEASALPLADGRSHPIRSGNSGAPQGTTTPTTSSPDVRLSSTAINLINDRLSGRDRAVLRSVVDHQFLTARHLERLYFDAIAPDARDRITRRALARLRGLRVLDTLDRRIGGIRAGSQGLIYHVGVAGDRLVEHRGRRSGRLRYQPTGRFLAHRLAVADAHVELIEADREQSIELVDSAVEPATWRRFTGLGAARRTLKPDLYAETATTDDLVRAWFIEIDLGTEHIPTLLAKCREYESYRQTGIEQDRHGAFPLVAWSLTHSDPATAERRRQALTEAIAADPRLPRALFRIVSPEGVLPLIRNGGVQ